jgi:acyl carrier protein
MITDEMDRQVIEFVAGRLGLRHDRVNVDTTLFGDLGVDGDDAVDFFQGFSEKFRVDLSQIDLSRYFSGEGCWPWQAPLLLFHALTELFTFKKSRKTPEERAGVTPITIGNLVAAVKVGHW